MTGSPPNAAPAAWILMPAGASTLEIWGLTPAERLRRSLVRAEATPIRTLGAGEAIETTGPVLLASGDWIYDERLIEALVGAPNTVLVTPAAGGVPVAAHVPADRADETLAALRAGEPRAPAGVRSWRARSRATPSPPPTREPPISSRSGSGPDQRER